MRITYPHIGAGAIEERELPFVVGVITNEAGRVARLARMTEPGQGVQFRVLSVTKEEVRKDLKRAPRFDQSFLFKRVHDDVFGVDRPEPFGLLVMDCEFGPDDVAMLGELAEVAAAIHAPLLAGAAPAMFGAGSWEEVAALSHRKLGEMGGEENLRRWRELRDRPQSRYLALVAPSFRVGGDAVPGSFALAEAIVRAFALHGWCSAITGVEGGGLVECVPSCAWDDLQEHALATAGFAPLTAWKGREMAVFFSAPSCHRPAQSEAMYSRLPHILPASRFVHYLRALLGNRRFASKDECETFVKAWLNAYRDAGLLGEFRFEIDESAHRGVVWLRSDYQLSASPEIAQRLDFHLPWDFSETRRP